MTTLDSQFEASLRDALMDTAEARIEELGELMKQVAAEEFQSYASRQGYDIEHIWQGAEGPFIDRGQNTVTATIEWPGLTALFEWGVSPHAIRGSPLAFHWASPPEGTRPPDAPEFVVAEEVNWGSVTGGIDEARAIRTARDIVRGELVTE